MPLNEIEKIKRIFIFMKTINALIITIILE